MNIKGLQNERINATSTKRKKEKEKNKQKSNKRAAGKGMKNNEYQGVTE